MFPTFIGILDIQSWWEVPSIAHFCSLFRSAFNLLDFDIEELEEALLTDGSEESASSLLTDLIVRLLCGCLRNNDVSAFNYQMFLRRLFRQKCQQSGRYNPFNTDIDFQFLPLRTKVEILYALCDFRLDTDDVCDLFKNLEAESLRVEPLGWDDNSSAYWYFYGTRLYREDYRHKTKSRKRKGRKKSIGDELYDDKTERIWQVVCFTETDWTHLTEKFSTATSQVEKELRQTLLQNFVPELPRLFQEKERQQRKRILELVPRRTSSRVLEKTKQKEVEEERDDGLLREQEQRREEEELRDEDERREKLHMGREIRARRRREIRIRSSSPTSDTVSSSYSEIIMPASKPRLCRQRTSLVVQKPSMAARKPIKKLRKDTIIEDKEDNSSSSASSRCPSPHPARPTVSKTSGRKTNNSLANATGQIVIPDVVEPSNSCRKKLKTSQIFGHSEMELQTDMYKIIEQLKSNDDAWPFLDPVEEEYAPNYYSVIRRPMDLGRMEDRIDQGYYTDFTMFRDDFKLIVNNCRLYNGQENEYTKMVNNLQLAFEKLTARYIDRMSSSDEEIAVEFQMPAPSRKHKLKANSFQNDPADEEPNNKKRKTHQSVSEEDVESHKEKAPVKTNKQKAKGNKMDKNTPQSDKKKEDINSSIEKIIGEKKRKSRRRHRRKRSKAEKLEKKKLKESRRAAKKLRKKAKLNKLEAEKKHNDNGDEKCSGAFESSAVSLEPKLIKRADSPDSPESSSRSRSASPLPSIHSTSTSRSNTPSLPPSPFPFPSPLRSPCGEEGNVPSSPPQSPLSSSFYSSLQLDESDFYKDKYDKIKERRRQTTKNTWDSVLETRPKSCDKLKQNVAVPEKEKNSNLLQTIEKLKEKNKEGSSIFDDLFRSSSRAGKRRMRKKSSIDSDSSLRRNPEKEIMARGKNVDEYEFSDDSDYRKRDENKLEEPKKKKQRYRKSEEFKEEKTEKNMKNKKLNNKRAIDNTIEYPGEATEKKTVEKEITMKKMIKKNKQSVTKKPKRSDPASKKSRVKNNIVTKDTGVKEPTVDTISAKEARLKVVDEIESSEKAPEQLATGTEVNESAANALEQAVIDISKWLDEPPKVIDSNPPSDIPATSSSVDEKEMAIVKGDVEDTPLNAQTEKTTEEKKPVIPVSKKEGKKVKVTKESGKVQRRRELQRTIDRLQPGKSKGNLLTNSSSGKPEEVILSGATVKPKEIVEPPEECSPKLRLGSVLQSAGFGLGSPFSKTEEKEVQPSEESLLEQGNTPSPIVDEDVAAPVVLETEVTDEVIDMAKGPPPPPPATPPLAPSPTPPLAKPSPDHKLLFDETLFQDKDFDVLLYQRQCQEKVTPNLSAWFKAFGTPKPGSAPPPSKKKTDVGDEPKPNKIVEPPVSKHKSPLPESTPLDAEAQVQVLNMLYKQRRMSTGSSVSERSSFSQDLDSPRHQVSHSSPLLRSPASPREEFQKISYPIHNGTVRAGFYQDTASVRSSPDKSCSPRDPSQSPYSPYSQHHVYASGNTTGSSNQTPIYFVDNTNKSPLPTYGHNQPPPYYDTSKAGVINRATRPHEDYTALGPNSPFHPPLSTISPGRSPYSQHSQHSPYAPIQHSPQTGHVSTASNIIAQSTDPHEIMASKRRISSEAVIEEIQARVPGVCLEAMEKLEKNLASVMPSPNDPPFRPTVKVAIPNIPPISAPPPQPEPLPQTEKVLAPKIETTSRSEETSQSNSQQFLPTTPTDLSFINMGLPIITKCEDERSSDRSQLAQVRMSHEKSITNDADLPIDMVKLGYGSRVANTTKNVDMINMGYYNTPEIDNRLPKNESLNMGSFGNATNLSNDRRNCSAAAKAYDMLNAAMSLGLTNPIVSAPVVSQPVHRQSPNLYTKSMMSSAVPEKPQNQFNLPSTSMMQDNGVVNFGRADIDLLSKKYYSSTDLTAQASAEFANWKMDAQTKKQDTLAYQNMYANDNMDMSKKNNINVPNPNLINYNNKPAHQSQAQIYSTRPATNQRTSLQQPPSELRIPNPRSVMNMSPVTSHTMQDMNLADNDLASRLAAATSASMQAEKNLQMMGALQYKTPYTSHSTNALDALRNIPNLPQMLDRYATDERFLSSYPSSYHEKTLQMAQMFGKNVSSIHTSNVSNLATFSHASMNMGMTKESTPPINYKMSTTTPTSSQMPTEPERKPRGRKKKTATSSSNMATVSSVNTGVAGAVSSVPGSAFNFGPSSLGSTLYAENAGFLSELRNSTANQLMAANYMAAAAAQQQSLGPDPSSPLYRQYLQRHRAAQMMGLYPPGYPSLTSRQPYDTIDRPNWL